MAWGRSAGMRTRPGFTGVRARYGTARPWPCLTLAGERVLCGVRLISARTSPLARDAAALKSKVPRPLPGVDRPQQRGRCDHVEGECEGTNAGGEPRDGLSVCGDGETVALGEGLPPRRLGDVEPRSRRTL